MNQEFTCELFTERILTWLFLGTRTKYRGDVKARWTHLHKYSMGLKQHWNLQLFAVMENDIKDHCMYDIKKQANW